MRDLPPLTDEQQEAVARTLRAMKEKKPLKPRRRRSVPSRSDLPAILTAALLAATKLHGTEYDYESGGWYRCWQWSHEGFYIEPEFRAEFRRQLRKTQDMDIVLGTRTEQHNRMAGLPFRLKIARGSK